jgi:signal-transduction protein with cAMP-binding, CBS, and nucleotidyltransferase domain
MYKTVKACEQREKVQFLRYVPILKQFQEGTLRNVANRLNLRTFEAGATLIKEGEQTDTVYFLKSGTASVYRNVDIRTKSGWAAQLLCIYFLI